MEEINLGDLFKYFVKKWYIILMIILLAVTMGVVYSLYIKKPLYSSSTTLVLAMSSDSTNYVDGTTNESITQNDIILNQKLVSTYREIIKSRSILKEVINSLNLEESYDELSDMVTVNSIEDTELINIKVIHSDPFTAKVIANKIASIFSNEIVDIYNIKNVKIIDYAEEARNPYNINFVKELIIYFLIGTVIGFGIVFVIYYFDTTIKSVEEVERKLELPILGAIPSKVHNRRSHV